MDDVVGPCEMLYRLGAQKTVCIGDYPDPHHCICATRRLCRPSPRLRVAFISAFPVCPNCPDMIRIILEAGMLGRFPDGMRRADKFRTGERVNITRFPADWSLALAHVVANHN